MKHRTTASRRSPASRLLWRNRVAVGSMTWVSGAFPREKTPTGEGVKKSKNTSIPIISNSGVFEEVYQSTVKVDVFYQISRKCWGNENILTENIGTKLYFWKPQATIAELAEKLKKWEIHAATCLKVWSGAEVNPSDLEKNWYLPSIGVDTIEIWPSEICPYIRPPVGS